MLIKRGLFNAYLEHTPMILGANAHIYALPGLHKNFIICGDLITFYIYTPVILISLCMNLFILRFNDLTITKIDNPISIIRAENVEQWPISKCRESPSAFYIKVHETDNVVLLLMTTVLKPEHVFRWPRTDRTYSARP